MNSTWFALADPNRLHIVEWLRDGPRTVGEIVDHLGLGQPQVSKHLRILSQAGLVEVRPIANRRIYKLRHEPFQALDAWLLSFRLESEDRFGRLDDYLNEVQGGEGHLRQSSFGNAIQHPHPDPEVQNPTNNETGTQMEGKKHDRY